MVGKRPAKACKPLKDSLHLMLIREFPMRNALPFVLLFALLVTSCSKEEAVQPCNSSAHQEEGVAKGLPVVTEAPDVSSDVDPQQGATEPGTRPPTDDPSGISDDGDDLSDSEKSRKKRR